MLAAILQCIHPIPPKRAAGLSKKYQVNIQFAQNTSDIDSQENTTYIDSGKSDTV